MFWQEYLYITHLPQNYCLKSIYYISWFLLGVRGGYPLTYFHQAKKTTRASQIDIFILWYLGSRISTCVIWIYSLYGSSKYSNNLSEKLDLSSGTRNPQSFPSEQNLQMSLDKIFSREKSQTWQGKSTLGTKVFLAEPDQAFLHLHFTNAIAMYFIKCLQDCSSYPIISCGNVKNSASLNNEV